MSNINVLKCKNGHFFDGNKYDKCPHCGEETENKTVNEGEKKKTWFSLRGKGSNDIVSSESVMPVIETNDYKDEDRSGVSETGALGFSPDLSPKKDEGKTLDFWQEAPNADLKNGLIANDDIPFELSDESKKASEESEKKEDISVAVAEPVQPYSEESHPHVPSSLMDEVKNASANNDGKTMSYFSIVAANGTDGSQKAMTDPVVGWLVGIAGAYFGYSFNIKTGQNSIGRNDENQIVLGKDAKVSRNKHALITYEPKKRNFYLQPGESSGLTYLNDDYISESKKLNAYDVIEIGDSKLLFFPLCGDNFSWEIYLPKEQ